MLVIVSSLYMVQVGGMGLVSEALSVLNGAHLNSSGRLGNLLRRYHHSLSTARDATSAISDVEVQVVHSVVPVTTLSSPSPSSSPSPPSPSLSLANSLHPIHGIFRAGGEPRSVADSS